MYRIGSSCTNKLRQIVSELLIIYVMIRCMYVCINK